MLWRCFVSIAAIAVIFLGSVVLIMVRIRIRLRRRWGWWREVGSRHSLNLDRVARNLAFGAICKLHYQRAALNREVAEVLPAEAVGPAGSQRASFIHRHGFEQRPAIKNGERSIAGVRRRAGNRDGHAI